VAIASPLRSPSTTAGPALRGWWGDDADHGYCIPPASYLLDGKAYDLGNCMGLFPGPSANPQIITLVVGEHFQVHMTLISAAVPRPLNAVPTSSDPDVLEEELVIDTATASYRAVSPGTALLMTTGSWCLVSTPSGLVQGTSPCRVAEVHVAAAE
jgi:hypothetical protein